MAYQSKSHGDYMPFHTEGEGYRSGYLYPQPFGSERTSYNVPHKPKGVENCQWIGETTPDNSQQGRKG